MDTVRHCERINLPTVNTSNWLPSHEPDVEHELFLLGYRNLFVTGFGQIVLAALVVLATYAKVDWTTIVLWSGYMALAGLAYWVEIWVFRPYIGQPGPNVELISRWYRHRRTIQFFSGLGWGGLGFLLVPEASAHNVFVMAAFTGVIGYSAAGNSANDFFGFVISAITLTGLFVSHLQRAFGAAAPTLMGMCFLYVGALTVVLRNTHAALRDSIRLRLSNQALALENARQAALAKQANRDKSDFLAAASHDLRQPVHALLLLIEAYRLQVPAAVDHPLMQNIIKAGQSISTLFNALMELSRLESGTEKPVLAEFEITAALQKVFHRSLPEAAQKGLVLRSFQAKRLASTVVRTDQLLLKRILGNLLANALRYTRQGGVLLSLRPAHGAGGLWIEVWDTGIGIAPADQSRIFDPYVQIANRERDRSKGLGLGLAIIKHACELLGLKISLQSRLGRGTCFRLLLPEALLVRGGAGAAPHLRRASAGVPLVAAAPWLRGRRVLLIDDDPIIQVAMQALLAGWGIDLRWATQGDATVLSVCGPDWVPECILCDFRLPGPLNGVQLLDYLQQQFPSAIGILQTGEMVQTVQKEAEEAGYMVLSKPVDAAVLASTLAAVLEPRGEERSS